MRGEGTGEMKEGSQKIISQGRKLSSSLDYDAVDVCCGDAINDREAVADAVVAGAIRDAAADAKSTTSSSPILNGKYDPS